MPATGLTAEYGAELLLPVGLLLAVLGLLFWRSHLTLRRKLDSAQRHVEMGLRFYDEDERFLSIKDEHLRYYMVNDAFASNFGKDQMDFHGKQDEELFDESLAATLLEMDQSVLERREKIIREILWQNRTFRMHKFPVMLPHGETGVGGYVEDMTEVRRSQVDRERINRRNEILLDVSTRDFRSSHEQLDYALKKALTLTESTYGYIYLYNESDRTFLLENFAEKGGITSMRKEKRQRYRLDRMGLWSESVKTGTFMIYNGDGASSSENLPEGISAFNMMTVPVIMEEKIVAVIGVVNSPSGYTGRDARELSLLMTGVWNAKERRESTEELRKANLNLVENKDKLALILHSSAEGIYGMDMEGKFTFTNKSALALLGYEDAAELIGRSCHELIHHSTREGLAVPREECGIYQTMGRGDIFSEEDDVFHRKDGSSFSVRYSTHPQIQDGRIIGSVVTFSDITLRKKQEEEVLYLSYHDALTGLYNRTYLEKIGAELTEQENLPLAIVVGDVNGLKLSNDIFGHNRGDAFLRSIADIIRKNLREEDLVFRVGGDEFYLFLKNTEEETAEKIMNRITLSIREETFHGIRGGIAMGLSVMKTKVASLEHVMDEAEQKMYREKTLTRHTESLRQLESLIEVVMKNDGEKIHGENTMKTAQAVGEALGLEKEDMTKLRDAAYLHDIGKIKKIMDREEVNPSILARRDHAVIGYRILNSFEQTMDIARIVLSHHEKWDGSGYPKGLQGEEIPLLSRIISVAESYDRLTSSFGRKSPHTPVEALEILKTESGRSLDPALVAVLDELMADKREQAGGGLA